MPLRTQIKRKGKSLKIAWGYPELSVMYTVALREGDPDKEYQDGKTFGSLPNDKYVDFSGVYIYGIDSKADLITKGEQVVKEHYDIKLYTDDNEPHFILEPGDVLLAWREHKS